jgi:TIR domain
MADIFVSYATADLERAAHLVKRLEAENWSVFWDRKIPAGTLWRQVLEAELVPASCVVVLWSKSSIVADWVDEEAAEGRRRGVLIPARLDRVEPPLGFRNVQACDLSDWDGRADSPVLSPLIDAIGPLLGKRRGVSIRPVDMHVVVGRPSVHGQLGATVNLTCEFPNRLNRSADILWLSATMRSPEGKVSSLDWCLLYDVSGVTTHVRRIEKEQKLRIPVEQNGSRFKTGIQLRAPIFGNVVEWPEGAYTFTLHGWVDRSRDRGANLRCDFIATLTEGKAETISTHLTMVDADWVKRGYHDNARGFPFLLSNVRPGLPAA